MRFSVILFVLLFAFSVQSYSQSPGDTTKIVLPQDKNCSDFNSQQSAQGWYDAISIITKTPDAHDLDADGDGQPCEGIQWGKVEDLSNGYYVRFELVPSEFECPTVDAPFTIDALQSQAITSATDSIPYRGESGVWPRWECVHTISNIVSK